MYRGVRHSRRGGDGVRGFCRRGGDGHQSARRTPREPRPLESKTNFVGAAKAGSTVTATATPIHLGRRTHVWQTRLETGEGRLVAIVTQTQMIL